MSIKATILNKLTPILANTWAVELPNEPAWPAIVFDITSTPEDTWVIGGGYDQHSITINVLARTLGEMTTLIPQIDAAMLTIPGYLLEGDRGDGAYEGDSSLYVYFINHTIRTPRY